MTENKCGYQMHIFVTSFSAQHASAWRCFCMVQPLRQPFRPKCTNRILQMHHQNPVVPSESDVHPQNPVCTYSVTLQWAWTCLIHYNDVIISAMASQITSLTSVYSTVYSRRRSKKTSKLSANGLCVGNSPVTGEFPAQMASTAEKCFHLMTSSCVTRDCPNIKMQSYQYRNYQYKVRTISPPPSLYNGGLMPE